MRSPSWIQWAVLAGAGAAASVAGRSSEKAPAPAPASAPQAGGPTRLERPEDPPGVPAPRVPGAVRSPPVQQASFLSFQVNVDSNGANIPGDAANEPSIAVDPTHPNRM